MKWQPIESAPKETVWTDRYHKCGEYILGYVPGTGVLRLHWWDGNQNSEKEYCNWLGDCGNAYRPTHWMPLPKPPQPEDDRQ